LLVVRLHAGLQIAIHEKRDQSILLAFNHADAG
jgi:hypothetical protein